MDLYPQLFSDDTESLLIAVRRIIEERNSDVQNYNNLNQIFMSGRKVGKIPTSSADIAATDRVGDFNYSASYLYLCVDDSGAKWRRIALASW